MSQLVRSTLFTALLAVAAMPFTARAASDTDGDGFPDVIETQFGSDPSLKSSTPTGLPAVIKPFDSGIFIVLGFAANDTVVVYYTSNTVIDPTTLANKSASFYVGGLSRLVTFDSTGMIGTSPNGDTTASLVTSDGVSQINIACTGDLASNFTDEGLLPNAASNKPVSIDAVLFLGDVLYTNPKLTGFYNFQADQANGVGFATFNLTDSNAPFDITLSNVSVSPSPAAINTDVTVSLDLKAKKISLSDISGAVDFGDGTQMTIDSTNIDAIKHQYTVEGIYDITISLVGTQTNKDDSSATVSVSATAFAVIGDDASVNANNGLVSKGTVTPADGVNPAVASFQVNSLEDSTVTDATTEFSDLDGTGTQATGTTRSRDTETGLFPTRSANHSSLVVAKTTAKSSAGEERGVARKTVAVGSRQTDPSNSGNVKPPKVNPGVVTVTKVTGKFIFVTDPTKNKPDSVSFNGELTLPEGFALTADGVRFAIGLGNVLDGIQIDAKGKAINKSKGDNSFLTKIAIKFPKLTGPATGMEKVKISATMSTADMDLKGFESEGITNRVRDDEAGRKAVDRMMQVNLLLGGEPYEAYIPVQFKLASKNGEATAGTMVTRRAN